MGTQHLNRQTGRVSGRGDFTREHTRIRCSHTDSQRISTTSKRSQIFRIGRKVGEFKHLEARDVADKTRANKVLLAVLHRGNKGGILTQSTGISTIHQKAARVTGLGIIQVCVQVNNLSIVEVSSCDDFVGREIGVDKDSTNLSVNLLHKLVDGFRNESPGKVFFTILTDFIRSKFLGAMQVLKSHLNGGQVGIVTFLVATIGLGEFLGNATRDKVDLNGLANRACGEVGAEGREEAQATLQAGEDDFGESSRGCRESIAHSIRLLG